MLQNFCFLTGGRNLRTEIKFYNEFKSCNDSTCIYIYIYICIYTYDIRKFCIFR